VVRQHPQPSAARAQFPAKPALRLAIAGAILGLLFSIILHQGYLVMWRALPDPPQPPAALASDGQDFWILTASSDAYILSPDGWMPFASAQPPPGTLPQAEDCARPWPQFSPFTRPPSHVILCIRLHPTVGEAVEDHFIALDSEGKLWEWSHLSPFGYTPVLCGACFPFYGLLFGFVIYAAARSLKAILNRLAA
jgi:hypothetical protein